MIWLVQKEGGNKFAMKEFKKEFNKYFNFFYPEASVFTHNGKKEC